MCCCKHVRFVCPRWKKKPWLKECLHKQNRPVFAFHDEEAHTLCMNSSACDFASPRSCRSAVSTPIQRGSENGEVIIYKSIWIIGFSRAKEGRALIMIISYTGSLFCYASRAKYGLWQSCQSSFTPAFCVGGGTPRCVMHQGSAVHYCLDHLLWFLAIFWGSCLFCVSSNSVLGHHMILQQVPWRIFFFYWVEKLNNVTVEVGEQYLLLDLLFVGKI